jgi:DNA-binding CsgD family transcriptional regulator
MAENDIEEVEPAKLVRQYLLEKDYLKASYWHKIMLEDAYTEGNIQRFLAAIQLALNENEYAECIKWLENAANEGFEIAAALLNYHNKEGKEVSRKFLEQGDNHFLLGKKAEEEGDIDTAREEFLKSFKSFLPAISSVKYKEYAETIKEKNKKRYFENLNLTDREWEIFRLLITDLSPKEIAYNLKISYPTVNFHTKNLYRKLGIQSRAELYAKFKK